MKGATSSADASLDGQSINYWANGITTFSHGQEGINGLYIVERVALFAGFFHAYIHICVKIVSHCVDNIALHYCLMGLLAPMQTSPFTS